MGYYGLHVQVQVQVHVHVHPVIATYPKTAAGAEVHHDANERRLDACADEPVQVVMRQFLHHVQLLFDGSRHLDMSHRQHLHGDDRTLVRCYLDAVWSGRSHVIQRLPRQIAEAGEKSTLRVKQTANDNHAMTTLLRHRNYIRRTCKPEERRVMVERLPMGKERAIVVIKMCIRSERAPIPSKTFEKRCY